MDREKLERLRLRYEHFKKRITDWEQAVYRTEGRKPAKDDMKQAPKEVQESYKELVKTRKCLEQFQKHVEIQKAATNVTPGKIFVSQRSRQLLQRSAERTYLTPRTKMFRRGSGRDDASESSSNRVTGSSPQKKAFSLGLRPNSSFSSPTSKNERGLGETSSSPAGPFKKLFKVSGETLGSSMSFSNKSEPSKPKDTESSSRNTDTDISFEFPPPKASSSSVLKFSNSDRLPFQTSNKFAPLMETMDANADEKESSELQKDRSEKLLKTPPFKLKQNQRPTRKLDSGWLARLNAEVEDVENCMKDTERVSSDNTEVGPSTSTSSNDKNNSSDSLPVDDQATMDVDANNQTQNQQETSKMSLAQSSEIVTHDNSDSGICEQNFFNSEELLQAVEEVLEETKTRPKQAASTSTSVISDADGSLLHSFSFSEDARLPTDLEQDDDFQSVEPTPTKIHDIIDSLSASINEDEETSTSWSPHEEKDAIGKKRPAFLALSPTPSPEKPKRKFFKSSKGERRAAAFQVSYKLPSPVKKTKKQLPPSIQSPGPSSSSKIKKSDAANKDSAGQPQTRSPKTVKKGKKAGNKKPVRSKKPKSMKDDDPSDNDEDNPKPRRKKNTVIDVFDEGAGEQFSSKGQKKAERRLAAKGRRQKLNTLEGKMNSGRVDENYVKIDTKKKVFVRGHKKVNAMKMKKLDWKNRKAVLAKEAKVATFTCHKCGEKGHFAKFCVKDTVVEGDAPGEEDESPFPSLEEAARMVFSKDKSNSNRVNLYPTSTNSAGQQETDQQQQSEIPADEPTFVLDAAPNLIESVEPYFETSDDDEIIRELEDQAIDEGLREFGYDSFRPGQKEAVRRVLKGLSTLVVLSTGTGKSLCYQLPAYLYQKKYPGALTLCISPLVSLMEDQIQGVPAFLNAACLHSNMTTKQKEVVLEKVKSKKLHILLVSPEAVCGGLFGLLRGSENSLPIISFACIDEVHCVSQWSHNFRPSYLQLCKILREKLNVKTILGLTATATSTTAVSVCEHLHIDPSTTIRGELIPRNLILSVSRDVYREEALITLLQGDRFRDCDSIIIYCTRREQCEKIAVFVRTKLQEITTRKVIKKSGTRLSGSCEAYHAGMSSRRRKIVQEGFMSGDIRIVVATVAFGMGIDKADIRAVIHYNMPSAFESYVQEIGRAGRDGLPAHCHLFLDNAKRADLYELKRHVHANSVDRPTIRKLLRKIFQPCKCSRIEKLRGNEAPSTSKKQCEGHEVSFSIDETVLDLDLPKENITTLLCYLELDEKKWIDILPLTYETCKIQSYGGAKLLRAAASKCPPLAAAVALHREKGKFRETDPFLEFNVIETAATLGWNSSVVKKELKNLEWTATQFDEKGNPTRFRKSGILVEFTNLAYRVKAPGNLRDEVADRVLNSLHGRNLRQEQTQLYQLQRVYQALQSVSLPNISTLCDGYDEDKSNQLKKFIYDYFTEDASNLSAEPSTIAENEESEKFEDLRRSIRHLVDSNRDINFTTRSIAKIFQGISSPCFPADVWFRNRDFWRKYLDIDFHTICRIAADEI